MSATSKCEMHRIDSSTQSALDKAAYGCQACAKIPQGSEERDRSISTVRIR